MTTSEMGVLEELHGWLKGAWDPDLTLRAWWARLAESGWSQPHWPAEWFGKGLPVALANDVTRAIQEFGAVTAPVGFATGMAGPTLLDYGTAAQKARHLPGMVNGTDAYCQLFSEPNAGSDLAGLQCRADRDGDSWLINGQKVWTSGGQIANKAILLARSDVDVPKHAGLSFFIIDVRQPGVEIRPLREMTGRSYFNEVFLTDARVPAEDLVGGEGNGWAVANTTLGLRAGALGRRRAGRDRRRRVDRREPRPAGGPVFPTGTRRLGPEGPRSQWSTLAALAGTLGRNRDPVIRDDLVRLYTLERLNTLNTQRARSLEQSGGSLPGLANLAKMAQNHAFRLGRHLTFALLQAAGTLHAYTEEGSAELDQRDRHRGARGPGRGGPVRNGPADLRGIGPDPAQHCRRPGPRVTPGAGGRQGRAV